MEYAIAKERLGAPSYKVDEVDDELINALAKILDMETGKIKFFTENRFYCKMRCSRPNNVPSDIPWSESMNVEFDPFVYRGDMSIKDFRQAQNNYLDDTKV
ncbi:MAG: hypothetical protein ACYDG2_20200 [Ruminiclostridium sp.]